MAITLSATFSNALLAHDATAGQSAVADQLGGGSLVIYSGSAPTGANEALSGNTALVSWSLAAAASWSAPSSGVLTLDFSSLTATATAGGTATFFRLLSSGGTSLVQGLISGDGLTITNTSIAVNDTVTLSAGPTLTLPVT